MQLTRAWMRFVSYKDRKQVAAALKGVCTAPTAEAAETAPFEFEALRARAVLPGDRGAADRRLGRFIPFDEFPAEIRRIMYRVCRDPTMP